MKIETVTSVLSALIVVGVVIYPKQKESALNNDTSILDQKIDSIYALIKKQDQKIDSIYQGLNYKYETIDTSNNATLRNMLNDFPTRTRH